MNNLMIVSILADIQTDINYLKKLAEKLIEMNKEEDDE